LVGFWKKKNKDEIINQEKEDKTEIAVEKRYEKAPFLIKSIVQLKIGISQTDPMMMILYLIGFVWVLIFAISILLPFAGVIGDMPNKYPMMGGVSVAFITWWFRGDFDRKRKGHICVIEVDGMQKCIDNRKIEYLPGGSIRLYVINDNGTKKFTTLGGNPERFGKQETVLVSHEINSLYGIPYGRNSFSYAYCSLKPVYMENNNYIFEYTSPIQSIEQIRKMLSLKDAKITNEEKKVIFWKASAEQAINDPHEFDLKRALELDKILEASSKQTDKQIESLGKVMGHMPNFSYKNKAGGGY